MSKFADEKNKKLKKFRNKRIKYIAVLDEGFRNYIQIVFKDREMITIEYDHIYGIKL